MDIFLGSITMVAFNYAPEDYLQCAGQPLSVSQNEALYSLIGNYFGGSGSQFNLPDLRGRVPTSFGQRPSSPLSIALGQGWGLPAVALTLANLPTHSHGTSVTNQVGSSGTNSISFSTGNLAVAPNIMTTATAGQGTSNVGGSNLGLSSAPPNGTSPVRIYGPVGGAAVAIGGVSGQIGGTPTVTAPQPTVTTTASLNPAGSSSQPVSLMQPTLPVNYLIATIGVYPSFQ